MLMSLRLFASKHLAALVLAGLAVGTTPAAAGGLFVMAPQPVHYYSGSCGGCGGYYVQQPQYYARSCGGCGSTYIRPQPTLQPWYYSGTCGGCGGTYAVPQPEQYGDDEYVTRQHFRRHVDLRHHRHRSHERHHANRY
jgi:hypothetical protein